MQQPDNNLLYQWHVAINRFCAAPRSHEPWMYDAKNLIDEIPRIAYRFMQERTGQLPAVHRQCSQSAPEPVMDNHLTCCLGAVCKECPFLRALELARVAPEQLDEMKAWTCAAHILHEKALKHVDDSEGYILTVDDKMFWSHVYESLSQGDPGETEGSNL